MSDYADKSNNLSTPVSGVDLKSNLITNRFERAINMKHQSQFWSKADVILSSNYR